MGARLVAVDSNSTDGTREFLAQRVDKVLTVPKGNLYAAVNAGMRELNSEWLTYINGDDLLYADGVAAAMTCATEKVDVVYGSIDYVDGFGRFLHGWSSPRPSQYLTLASQTIMPIPQQGTLFRRKVFDELGGFDVRYKYSSDFDFFLRAKLAGFQFHRLKAPRVAAFRIHGSQISQSREREMIEEARDAVSRSGLNRGAIQRVSALTQFRASNWDAYLIRTLRARQLTGGWRLRRTMEI